MAETRHTPGPWFVESRFIDGDNGVLDRDGFRVAEATTWQSHKARNGRLVRREISIEEQVANITLIAAAPELLAELKRLLAAVEADDIGPGHIEDARAAVAKAEGRDG